MKNTITGLLTILISFSVYAQQIKPTAMTTKEREYAMRFLKETETAVYSSVKSLTDKQLNFKAAADKWSVAECVKHIAAAETNLWTMVDASLKQTANPEQRTGIKFSDEDLVKAVEDRTHKSKTFEALEPANSPYKTVDEALAAFKQNRAKLIAFMQTTKADLRNHISVLPIGTYDAYQFVLLISAHTNRHTQQIQEVKANAGF
ncbi:DinB family protein [Mucilaginibacter antarcticus]|uniref:DinB family protein n=1 Tax=Mucilaginibacter antarcticus TaxID=1855725 RepID=A0ABW5XJA6_9SPHI